MAKDPVCGMEVKEENLTAQAHGKKYIFCSEYCRDAFEKNPSKYLKETSTEKKSAARSGRS